MLIIGKDTGSLINHLYSRMTKGQPTPEVGMGATLLAWTDRYPATIIAFDANKAIVTVQEDTAKVVKGNTMDGSAEYEFERDPNGGIHHFRFTTDKGWRSIYKTKTGRWANGGGFSAIRIGARGAYRDPSF